ncbi:MAG: alpha-ribazole phosphatase [Peptococcaceae bacterium]|nr:alpha-ribazole phosphatase [Peptococcaceae bacterium]
MSCRVFLIRHGETLWNTEMRFQGHVDVPLSEKGMEQARALAVRLSAHKISAVYSSDLGRAVETARRIAEPRGLEVITLPALREMNFGLWEGLTFKEIREKYGETIRQWWANPLGMNVPGGESLSDLVARVIPAVREIVEKHRGEKVAVVCHGGPVRCLVGTVLNMDLNKYWKIRQDNAALNILDFSGWENGIVALLNDRSHLPGDLEMPYWANRYVEKKEA